MRKIFVVLLLAFLTITLWVVLLSRGIFGERQGSGEIVHSSRHADTVTAKNDQESAAQRSLGWAAEDIASKQILFGDLHVHSTYSFDAYTTSLPMYNGEGSHPPADACDFARYCSGLDFWSINDHAEGLTPAQWSMTKDIVRQCNAAAGDPANPDMVTFLGWEWSQIGDTPEQHFGHKNIILRDVDEGSIPARPISSRDDLIPGGESVNPYGTMMRLLYIATAQGDRGRQPYHDFVRFLQDRDDLVACERGTPVRDLPADCQEGAPTPTELFAKLDDWGFPYLVIPHGNSWGFYTPPLTSWDKQLKAHTDPVRHEPLIEVFSGHGNSEQYRPWRALEIDAQGQAFCPAPVADYLPECWQAGEIIRKRCLDVGESVDECEQRAVAARANFILTKDSGHWTIPGSKLEDWLDAGQCRDCYMPAYNYRPGGSVQYGLAIRDFSGQGDTPKRFRWGLIGSSDVHSARPGTGYKEFNRFRMTDAALGLFGPPREWSQREPEPRHIPLEESAFSGPYFERFASFFGTGGLVAVHSSGRDRQSIWDALQRKEVYGTSGDRILLWFDLLAPRSVHPMGSDVLSGDNPVFEVRAVGAFEQKPGCPADVVNNMPDARIQRLCGGECYHPGSERKRIDRIEVVRIRPQISADEDVSRLIEDPWKVLKCPDDNQGCRVEFSDPEFAAAGRDSVYYVRAIEAASATINGDQLRCSRDEKGQCIAVSPCDVSGATAATDDCLAMVEERAWSSPIFVDYDRAKAVVK